MNTKYINPYLAGVLLGIVLLAAFWVSGRGLGASGAVKSVVVTAVNTVAPTHAENAKFYSEYNKEHENPMKNWLVFELLGAVVGALISGAIFGRLKITIDHGPQINAKKRIVFAIIGGALFGIGSQFARGCTSGAALTGMANLSAAGFLSMIFIFGTGYVFAYFFRKNWI